MRNTYVNLFAAEEGEEEENFCGLRKSCKSIKDKQRERQLTWRLTATSAWPAYRICKWFFDLPNISTPLPPPSPACPSYSCFCCLHLALLFGVKLSAEGDEDQRDDEDDALHDPFANELLCEQLWQVQASSFCSPFPLFPFASPAHLPFDCLIQRQALLSRSQSWHFICAINLTELRAWFHFSLCVFRVTFDVPRRGSARALLP